MWLSGSGRFVFLEREFETRSRRHQPQMRKRTKLLCVRATGLYLASPASAAAAVMQMEEAKIELS
jgi:hypothetical protein